MTPSARLSAAIEVLDDIETRRRPATDALKDWGLAHRFAGSGDRAAIATLAYDCLRRRSSARWLLDDEGARATLIGMLALQRRLAPAAIASLFSGERFAPQPLSEAEQAALAGRAIEKAPDHIQADIPEWLWAAFSSAMGSEAVAEGRALAERAPLDLRANTLKTSRDKLVEELAPLGAQATPLSPWGVRIPLGDDGRSPSVQSEESFIKGLFEIQDEGSQLAGKLADARPSDQVLDLCAGGGGKTLELAAAMGNKGQIFATDSDKRRLAPIHDRLARAGVRNVQVRTPRGPLPIDDLAGNMDLVLIDAPCSGSGTWRRNPDAKWRLRPNSLGDREKDQAKVLREGAKTVRRGGRLVYITCSLFEAENDQAIRQFLTQQDDFHVVAPAELAANAGLADLGRHVSTGGLGLQFSPHRTGTDGFYVCALSRE